MRTKGYSSLLLFLSFLFGVLPAHAQEVIQLAIHPSESFYVHPVEDVSIFSDVTNSGSFGSSANATIDFYGQRWNNRSGSRVNDNSSSGLRATGGDFRFLGYLGSSQYINTSANSSTNLSFPSITVNNGQRIILEGADLEVRNQLQLLNGHIVLNNSNLVLGNSANLSGFNANSFVITGSGTGGPFMNRMVNGLSQSDLVFPIGTAPNSYTPVALNYTGVPQTISARVFDNVYDKATFGVPDNSNVATKTWALNYTNIDANALVSLRLQHNQNEEAPEFSANRSRSYISKFDTQNETWDISSVNGLSPGILTTGNAIPGAFVNARMAIQGTSLNEFYSKSIVTSLVTSGLRIPEGISPNEDGLNDKFVIQNLGTNDKVRIDIYNRWQSLVYRNADYKNDFEGIGNQNGLLSNVLPDGTYYYILNINDEKPITGYIIINR